MLCILVHSYLYYIFKFVLTIWGKVKDIIYQFGVEKNGNVVELQHVFLKDVNRVLNGTKHHQVHLLSKMVIIIVQL